jgi:hypothetical protein
MHRLFGQQDQGGSADIATLDLAAAASPTLRGFVPVLETACAVVSSFIVHRFATSFVWKTLSGYNTIYRDAT